MNALSSSGAPFHQALRTPDMVLGQRQKLSGKSKGNQGGRNVVTA
jgi:hypothetical protein